MHVILYTLTLTQRKSICVCMLCSVWFAMKNETEMDDTEERSHWGFRLTCLFLFIPALPHSLAVSFFLSLSLHVSSYVRLPLNLYLTSETLTCPHHYSVSKQALPVVLRKWLIFSWRRWLISHRWHQLHPWPSCAPMMTVSLPLCQCLFLCTIKLPMPLWLHVSFITHTPLFCFSFFMTCSHYRAKSSASLVTLIFLHNSTAVGFQCIHYYHEHSIHHAIQKVLQRPFGVFYIGFDLCRFQFWVLFS